MYYKLTDEKGQTYGGTQWGEGITHRASGGGHDFCSPDLIHCYNDPLLAVLLNPIHADFVNPQLWEIEVEGAVFSDKGLKFGAKHVTTIRSMELIEISLEQRIRFAILCALKVYTELSFVAWAEGWLSGRDRAWAAAEAAIADTTWAAADAAEAAWAAAEAAWAAATWAATETAARAAARAAEAAARAAEAAARAAEAAARAAGDLDLPRLAKEAVT